MPDMEEMIARAIGDALPGKLLFSQRHAAARAALSIASQHVADAARERDEAITNGQDRIAELNAEVSANEVKIAALVDTCEAALEFVVTMADNDEYPEDWDITKKLRAALSSANNS